MSLIAQAHRRGFIACCCWCSRCRPARLSRGVDGSRIGGASDEFSGVSVKIPRTRTANGTHSEHSVSVARELKRFRVFRTQTGAAATELGQLGQLVDVKASFGGVPFKQCVRAAAYIQRKFYTF